MGGSYLLVGDNILQNVILIGIEVNLAIEGGLLSSSNRLRTFGR